MIMLCQMSCQEERQWVYFILVTALTAGILALLALSSWLAASKYQLIIVSAHSNLNKQNATFAADLKLATRSLM